MEMKKMKIISRVKCGNGLSVECRAFGPDDYTEIVTIEIPTRIGMTDSHMMCEICPHEYKSYFGGYGYAPITVECRVCGWTGPAEIRNGHYFGELPTGVYLTDAEYDYCRNYCAAVLAAKPRPQEIENQKIAAARAQLQKKITEEKL